MDDLQFIVQRLNAAPFKISVRAVDFEQKTPEELLKVTNDVVSSLNSKSQLSNVEQKDQIIEQLVNFLTTHKCKLLPSEESERIEWTQGLLNGQKTVSVLHWLLSNYEHLQMRCYLAKFLMPVEVPQEYLHPANSKLAQMAEAYRELQEEFVAVHKDYERFNSSGRSASALVQDIKQLGVEKQQLLDRLEREKNQVSGNNKFAQLLQETSKMRQGQDDEIRLREQRHKQHQLMNAAKQRLTQVRHLHDLLRVASIDSKSSDQIMNKIEEGLNNSYHYLETIYNRRNKLELKLQQVTNIFESSQDAQEIEDEHVNTATAKLREKQEELKAKDMEKEILESSINKLRDSDADNPQSTEFEQFRIEFRGQKALYENAKQEIESMQEINQELKQTEQRIKFQIHELEVSLKSREEKAGVVDYRDVYGQLEQTSKDTVALNELKSQTLDEISHVIQKIAFALEGKRKELEPKVHELKRARARFHDFQENFRIQKVRYEELLHELQNDNEVLEKECARLQEQWMERERKYHLLCASREIVRCSLEDADLHSLLETKVAEQEELVNDLRKQRRHMKEKEDYNAKQKTMFLDLFKLLELRAKTLDEIDSFLDDGVTNDCAIPIAAFY